MADNMRELSIEEIVGLGTPSNSRVRKAGLDTSDRSATNWFKFHARFGFCSNPDCLDDRERKVADGNAMVCEIDGTIMCRICFMSGYKNGE